MSDEALGTFEEQVMLAVLHARDEAYGMSVRREIEARTDREVSIGAVYATLDRLEAKGLVSSNRVPGVGGGLFRTCPSSPAWRSPVPSCAPSTPWAR